MKRVFRNFETFNVQYHKKEFANYFLLFLIGYCNMAKREKKLLILMVFESNNHILGVSISS